MANYFTLRAAIEFPLPGLRRKTVRLGEGADGERVGIGLEGGVPIASENNSPVKIEILPRDVFYGILAVLRLMLFQFALIFCMWLSMTF